MKLLEPLKSNERAVSPVLGVALLIAITVILAGVVGFVVLGVDTQGTDAPQTQVNFQQTANASGTGSTVNVVHDGGDRVTLEQIDVRTTTDGNSGIAVTDPTGTFVTGNTQQVATDAEEGDVIRLVWEDPDSDREVLLAEYTAEAP